MDPAREQRDGLRQGSRSVCRTGPARRPAALRRPHALPPKRMVVEIAQRRPVVVVFHQSLRCRFHRQLSTRADDAYAQCLNCGCGLQRRQPQRRQGCGRSGPRRRRRHPDRHRHFRRRCQRASFNQRRRQLRFHSIGGRHLCVAGGEHRRIQSRTGGCGNRRRRRRHRSGEHDLSGGRRDRDWVCLQPTGYRCRADHC